MNDLPSIFLEISLFSSVVILVIAAVNKLTCKNHSTKWKFYIWMILAVRMVIPFNFHVIELPFEMPVSQENLIQEVPFIQDNDSTTTKISNRKESNSGGDTDDGLATALQENQVSNHSPVLQQSQQTTTQSFIMILGLTKTVVFSIIWIVGMGSFLLYHGLTYVIFLKRMKRWKLPVTNQETKQIFAVLLKELGVKKKIKLEVCKYVSSPMMVGVLRPKVILPSEDFTIVQMKIILKHELIHYKHRDLYFKFLLLGVNAIHWFNPLAYYMVKLANRDMELFCDEAVVCKQDAIYRRLYSLTILQTITRQSTDRCIAMSTYFHGGKKQIQYRFSQIMNGSFKKDGRALFFALFGLILISGSLVACGTNNAASRSVLNQRAETAQVVQNSTSATVAQTKTSHILLVGMDDSNENSVTNRSDSIMLVTIQPESKTVTLTSFLRDMYVAIPDNGHNKLAYSYSIGGMELLKKTVEMNFNLIIDGTVAVDFSGFESIIDKLGGISLSLTEKEASYLNQTNYISNPANRTVKAGEQTLNGNQALGYTRIRHVETVNGVLGDIGRTARQRSLLLALYEKYKKSNLTTLLAIMDASLPYITMDLQENQILPYLRVAMDSDCTLNSLQIPDEGTYEAATIDSVGVLDADILANQEILREIIKP